jgi:TetR/AcrR family transcriptional regulator
MIYHRELFDRLPGEKRENILAVAAREFAGLGYQAANINIIAEKCGVSVGALYKYFGTKENLFLAVCSTAVEQLTVSLEGVEREGGSLLDKIGRLIRIIQTHSREQGALINLYNEITTEANRDRAARLSYQLESLSAAYYRRLIEEAQRAGEIAPGTDAAVGAFCMDNLFMTLQFSYASEYYRDRMKIYISETILDEDERVREGLLSFISKGLGIFT